MRNAEIFSGYLNDSHVVNPKLLPQQVVRIPSPSSIYPNSPDSFSRIQPTQISYFPNTIGNHVTKAETLQTIYEEIRLYSPA